jgi:hypothetical protein
MVSSCTIKGFGKNLRRQPIDLSQSLFNGSSHRLQLRKLNIVGGS